LTDFVVAECAIRQLHARYADAVYRLDFDAFGDCFTEDCRWTIGGAVIYGRAAIVDYNRTLFTTKFRKLFITLRTPILEVGEGTASGRTYFSGQNILADGTSYAPTGIYYERFVDQGDRWRFAWRLFETHYSGPIDFSGTFFENPNWGPPPNMPPLDAVALNHTGRHTQGEVRAAPGKG
jgi:uncharacterized protein (TIGR02246 family)